MFGEELSESFISQIRVNFAELEKLNSKLWIKLVTQLMDGTSIKS